MSIHDLHRAYDISERAYRICLTLGLDTTDDLRRYFKENGGFTSVWSCGRKTNSELIDIIKEDDKNRGASEAAQWVTKKVNERVNEIQRILFSTVPILGDFDRQLFDIFFQKEFRLLHKSARNAILRLNGGQPPSSESVKENFLGDSFDSADLKAGLSVKTKVKLFRFALLEFYNKLHTNSFSINEKNRMLLNSIVGFQSNNTDYLFRLTQRTFPILVFANDHLEKIFSFGYKSGTIFRNQVQLFDRFYTTNDLENKLQMRQSTIHRQSKRVRDKLKRPVTALDDLLPYTEYSALRSQPFIKLNDLTDPVTLREEIKQTSPVFAAALLGLLLDDTYYSFSPLDRLKPNGVYKKSKYIQARKVKGSYLVRRDVISKPELLDLYESIVERACKTRKEPEHVEIKNLSNTDNTPELVSLITLLLRDEFRLTVSNDVITFQGSPRLMILKDITAALENLDRPGTAAEILDVLRKMNLDYNLEKLRLKDLMSHAKEFIHFGRSGTYGLKKWEDEKDNIKGGTIGEIIHDYLQRCSSPKHVTELATYVRKYRPETPSVTIFASLRLDRRSRFRYFANAFIGIRSKNYRKTKVAGIEINNPRKLNRIKILSARSHRPKAVGQNHRVK